MYKKNKTAEWVKFAILLIFALLVLYPLIWMVGSSFKPEADIFTDLGIIPKQFTLENYEIGWRSNGRVTFSTYFLNSIIVSGLCVIGNLFSCTLAAFAFARLNFKGKNLFFALATDAFFVYLLIQSIRGIPRELDEAAIVDGCSAYKVFWKVILPLCQPALVTTTIFTFMWSWNDFFTQIIYLRTNNKYTVTLALRMFVDPTAKSAFGAMFAMSTVSIIPILLLFVFFQKQLIEGIATSGLKG